MHKLKINLTPQGAGSQIELDGKKLRGVRKIEIEAQVDFATLVKIEMYAEVSGEIEPDDIVKNIIIP